ncbi:MAG: YqiJ family protein [Pseudomonadota bacterium]
MIELLTHEKAFPFAVSLALMALLLIMELITMAFGTALSSLVDGALPDLATGAELDVEMDAELGSQLSLAAFLSWLKLDQLPALVVLIVFLASFGLLGLTLQSVIASQVGEPMRASLAAIITLPLTLPVMRPLLGGIAKVMPKDETEAVDRSSFVGTNAVITLGTARPGSPAQARLTDVHGQTHYVMVEPEAGGPELASGSEVVIVELAGNSFVVRAARP